MSQKLRGRLFDPVVWFKQTRKMLTGDGGRHRGTLRHRREEAGAAGRVSGPLHVPKLNRRGWRRKSDLRKSGRPRPALAGRPRA